MGEISRERMDLEDQVRIWVDAPSSDQKQRLAAPLILRLIDAMRDDDRPDFAKDQIHKAIRALWRKDTEGASGHLEMALLGIAHKPVDLTWDDLAEKARELDRGHPEDDPRRVN